MAERDQKALGKQIGRAWRAGRQLLGQADLVALPAAQPLLAVVRQHAPLLQQAPRLRISASRQIQGAVVHRRRLTELLACGVIDVRRRITQHFRGPGHLALRRAFGQGLGFSEAKAPELLRFSEQVLKAAAAHPGALTQVRVPQSRIRRLGRLLDALRRATPELQRRRRAKTKLLLDLATAAQQVEAACQQLQQLLAEGAPAAAAPAAPPGPLTAEAR